MYGWVKPIQQNNFDFTMKSREQVLKVKQCTYTNDVTSKAYYYICQCVTEDFAPVCETVQKFVIQVIIRP